MADPDTTSAVQLERLAQLDPDNLGAAEAVLDAATRSDGVAPVSEQGRLRLRYGGPHAQTLLARLAGEVVGVGQLDTADGSADAELAVHPAYRRHGVGHALAGELHRLAAGDLRIWAHGDLPGAVALAGRLGYERARVLWRLRRPLRHLQGTDLPDRQVPDRFVVRTFVPGQDEERWLRVNSRAFAHHPEQGSLTIDDLRQREREDWFDPAGFFLAEYADAPAGELAGFHWTKVHPNSDGEIYVLGVDPSTQGTGLGAALAVVGLRHLRDRGLASALLYVDEDNTAAMALYERLGFERDTADAQYLLRHG